jgi:hypothetical protein
MKIELETLLERVVGWPDAAQDRLLQAVCEIEAQQRGNSAQAHSLGTANCGNPTALLPSRADAETQAFIKRHGSSFF